MKIMFVYSADDIDSSSHSLKSRSKIQLGISYISSLLKANGLETRLLLLGSGKWDKQRELIKLHVKNFEPAVLCFTAVFSQYAFIEKAASFVKKNWPEKFCVIGGVHATLNPDIVIKGPFDALCVGEGEFPILELCKKLDAEQTPRGIPNMLFKLPGGEINRTEPRNFLEDLEILPFPDRDMWEPWIKNDPNDELTLLVGRGCLYGCTYCSNHAIRRVAKGKYVRMRSPENIISEIESIHTAYSQRKIYLEVEAIALDKKWVFDLCGKLAAFNDSIGNSISYGCNFRVSRQTLDEDLFAAFEMANVRKINIGLESGSERLRRDVLKRNYSNDDFLKTVAFARKYGMSVNVYNLIGIPGESLEDHMETVRMNHICQPDNLCTSIFFPYPGTELYKVCIDQGLISESIHTTKERRTAVLDLPGFSSAQIQRSYRLFSRRVYKGRYPFWKNTMRTILDWIPLQARSAISCSMGHIHITRWVRDYLKAKLFGAEKL